MLATACCYCLLQELCEADLITFLAKVKAVMYHPVTGAPKLATLAPILSDICAGMLYLHSRNIVHGGAWLQV